MSGNKKPTMPVLSLAPSSRRSRQAPNARMVQNFHLVWLDASIDKIDNDDCRNSITKLRQVVNTVNTFIDVDDCIDFIDSIKVEKTFLISSGALGQIIVPVIHNKPQVNTIYIFCGNKARHEIWAKEWSKVKDVYTDITPICEVLKQAVLDCDQNSISISFVKASDEGSNRNLDTLDPSFMYTQILKEILLTINFGQEHINDFVIYCRTQLADNSAELEHVDEIEKEYQRRPPIWWYTYECFLYSMLNRALRSMEVDRIIKMGFFVRDLHYHIVALHAEQYVGQHHSESFIVYRGQGLSQTDFEQLKKTPGGLLSFNNFLSTSESSDVSLKFAQRSIDTSNLVGVLFSMKIDPSISATPFAKVGNVGYYHDENEILFSMHSVFRIGQIKQIDKNNRLWQVNLTLTSEKDPQLQALTECIRKEIKGSTGWQRLGELMIKLGQFNKAEELYKILLEQTTDESEKAHLFYQLGRSENEQEKYAEAIESYEKALEIKEKILPPDHPDFGGSYNNIGMVYANMGKHPEALSYYQKAHEIVRKTLPANDPCLATYYSNIGGVYDDMGEYAKALASYEKAIEIYQKTLPPNHPSMATSYNNIGIVYKNMGEHSKAFSYYERALNIFQSSLPSNHPHLQTVRESMAFVTKNCK